MQRVIVGEATYSDRYNVKTGGQSGTCHYYVLHSMANPVVSVRMVRNFGT